MDNMQEQAGNTSREMETGGKKGNVENEKHFNRNEDCL